MVGGGYLLFPVLKRCGCGAGKAGQGKLHIRLSRSQLHVTNQNVLTLQWSRGGVAAYRQRIRPAGRLRLEPRFPIANWIGLRGDGLAVEADGDVFPTVTPTPDSDWAVALQD